MRIISKNTLQERCQSYKDAEQALLHWYSITLQSNWKTPNELKQEFQNASIIDSKRVVFNIKGNDYRLIVDIEYRIGLVFIVDVLKYTDYDKINVKDLCYVKTN